MIYIKEIYSYAEIILEKIEFKSFLAQSYKSYYKQI